MLTCQDWLTDGDRHPAARDNAATAQLPTLITYEGAACAASGLALAAARPCLAARDRGEPSGGAIFEVGVGAAARDKVFDHGPRKATQLLMSATADYDAGQLPRVGFADDSHPGDAKQGRSLGDAEHRSWIVGRGCCRCLPRLIVGILQALIGPASPTGAVLVSLVEGGAGAIAGAGLPGWQRS